MPFIYVTGIAGSGKSAVCEELVRRGYEAHEADNTLSAFYNNESGETVKRPTAPEDRTPEWRRHHTWRMSRHKLLALKRKVGDKPVFVCGVAANEEEYIDVFDIVYALSLDLPTVTHRLLSRNTGDFGKSEHEMKTLIEWAKNIDDYYHKIGAHIIDASKPIAEVVDAILEDIESST